MPQFLSALIIICAIIVVSQLVRLSTVLLAFGLSLENVFLPFLFIILPFLSIAIPIAYLFAVVLTFARLSADGEYAALLASGYSLRRAGVPVMLLAAALYGVAATSAMYFEAWGRREFTQFFYRKTQTELDSMIKYRLQPGVFLDDFLGYVLYAERISADRARLENILVAPGERQKKSSSFVIMAPTGAITGTVQGGDLKLTLDYGVSVSSSAGSEESSLMKFRRAEIDLVRIFQEQILGNEESGADFRNFSPRELKQYIDELAQKTPRDESLFRRAAYLYYSRMGSPAAVIAFALFGMVLGVSDPRRGKSGAYLGAILTIITGYILLMGADWMAKNGVMRPQIAAFLPSLILSSIGIFLWYQKNRLPPSESTLAWSNLPFVGRSR